MKPAYYDEDGKVLFNMLDQDKRKLDKMHCCSSIDAKSYFDMLSHPEQDLIIYKGDNYES